MVAPRKKREGQTPLGLDMDERAKGLIAVLPDAIQEIRSHPPVNRGRRNSAFLALGQRRDEICELVRAGHSPTSIARAIAKHTGNFGAESLRLAIKKIVAAQESGHDQTGAPDKPNEKSSGQSHEKSHNISAGIAPAVPPSIAAHQGARRAEI